MVFPSCSIVSSNQGSAKQAEKSLFKQDNRQNRASHSMKVSLSKQKRRVISPVRATSGDGRLEGDFEKKLMTTVGRIRYRKNTKAVKFRECNESGDQDDRLCHNVASGDVHFAIYVIAGPSVGPEANTSVQPTYASGQWSFGESQTLL